MKTAAVTIDKGIPVPNWNATELTDILRKLDVGDSFQWKVNSPANIYLAARRIGLKIVSRKVDDRGTRRYWRVA